ncbi:GNAT family N-acetyltransferase [Paenibacillus sp. Z6-24]
MLKLRQLSDISELQIICEKHDQVMLKLNWDMLKNRSPGSTEDFFHYEQERLVAYLAVYQFGPNIEVCGMTHPEHRRQGLFTALWQQAADSGVFSGAHQVLLNVPRDSTAGQAWIHTIRTALSSVEYSLKLNDDNALLSPVSHEIAVLRPFREDDSALWARLDADAFDIAESSTLAALNSPYRSLSRVMHVIEHSGLAAGKIEVDRQDTQSWIYGFVIDPALRGHGIGRSALRQVAAEEKRLGQEVWLNVVSDNDRALHLYESCGFVHQDIQDYYEYQGIPLRSAAQV